MYKNNKINLTISGGHSILVDKLTEEQLNKQHDFLFNKKIEDKYLLLSCFSSDFEKIEPTEELLEIYHLCLENEDYEGQYGIWVNGILSESCSISHFKNHFSN